MTSHAAVVARGMGKPCVSGAGSLRVDYAAQTMSAPADVQEGRDDHHRRLDRAGAAPAACRCGAALSGEFAHADGLGRQVRKLKVRANADTPNDARVALKFGAEGIGLCRTEHMFFDADRIRAVREMILADDEKGRRAALAKLLPMQRGDFTELFEIMQGCR
jgi:pyruvate,orthophosphate dikinase